MASYETDRTFNIGHALQDRDRVGWFLLLFCLTGAAGAWSVQLATNASLGGTACLVGFGQNAAPILGWWWAIVGVNLGALLIGFAALGVSIFNFVRTEKTPEEANEADVVSAGSGRTRFLSMWGAFTSVLFLLAIAFNTIAVFWGGLCTI
jgi:hypothetical protein